MWRPISPERPQRVEAGTGFITHCHYAVPAGGALVPPPARPMRLRVCSSLERAGEASDPRLRSAEASAGAGAGAIATFSVSFVGDPAHVLVLRGGDETFEIDGHELVSSWGLTASPSEPDGPAVVVHELTLQDRAERDR